MRALLGLCAVGLVGCFKGAAPPPAAPPPPPPKPVKHSVALGDPLGFLPADAQIVGVVDLKELRTSMLWKRLDGVLRQRAGATLITFISTCQFDPVEPLRRVSFGFRDVSGAAPSGVLVIRGYRRDLVMSCLDKMQNKPPEYELANGVISMTRGQVRTMSTFVDDTTLVIRFGPGIDRAAFDETLDSGAPLRMTAAYEELASKLDSSHPLWVMVLDGSIFKGQTGAMNASALIASAKIGAAHATASIRLRLADPADAANFAAQFQAQLASIASMFGDITAIAEDTDLVLTARMTGQQLDSLVSLLGPSLGIP